jgi:hypothetical protein
VRPRRFCSVAPAAVSVGVLLLAPSGRQAEHRRFISRDRLRTQAATSSSGVTMSAPGSNESCGSGASGAGRLDDPDGFRVAEESCAQRSG